MKNADKKSNHQGATEQQFTIKNMNNEESNLSRNYFDNAMKSSRSNANVNESTSLFQQAILNARTSVFHQLKPSSMAGRRVLAVQMMADEEAAEPSPVATDA